MMGLWWFMSVMVLYLPYPPFNIGHTPFYPPRQLICDGPLSESLVTLTTSTLPGTCAKTISSQILRRHFHGQGVDSTWSNVIISWSGPKGANMDRCKYPVQSTVDFFRRDCWWLLVTNYLPLFISQFRGCPSRSSANLSQNRSTEKPAVVIWSKPTNINKVGKMRTPKKRSATTNCKNTSNG